ncbi:putative membrane protein [Zopfia rhizophila CBS 207.26]|uniref:Putative membrane protein n=1 Tax=Zopfia rhizophila CBS 207.26 TaxID=1314779 RepID=A0A6A6DRT8_9PEZI|nr:putative membrane protein [Zopfia rhizophila CBS 207.26]
MSMSSAEKPQPAANVSDGGSSFMKPKLNRNKSTMDNLDELFVGPRALDHHSKWPIFLRLHGSITPEMAMPLLFVGAWSTAITCISKLVHDLGINQLLLTVLGFVVGLALSFRSSTAYERYNEGRKYWAQLALASQNLARLIWVHVDEREGELAKKDLLAKVNCINLIHAFAVAVKHKLRFEPFADYDDLRPLVQHLETYANDSQSPFSNKEKSIWKKTGEFLGVPMAESNPRKLIKRADKPLGNLPLEILNHLNAYMKSVFNNGTFEISICQAQSLNAITTMNDVYVGTDRILNTPLPIAYSIAIGQITWVYILLLPFQLFKSLGWVTIPASIFAAYIILGIALIGREIENPFGDDVNDLDLDAFCDQIRRDIDIITSRPAPNVDDFTTREDNALLYPLSYLGYQSWGDKSLEEIRKALRSKPDHTFRSSREEQ